MKSMLFSKVVAAVKEVDGDRSPSIQLAVQSALSYIQKTNQS